GICRLRILVQVLHVRVCRRAVEVEVVFLDVFAVVGLAVGQAVHPFLEDRVFAVPHGYAEAQELAKIADTGHAVFAPVIGARAGLVMSEVVPGVSVLAVVLANCTPLPLAQVGPHFLQGALWVAKNCCFLSPSSVPASSSLADSGFWDISCLVLFGRTRLNRYGAGR